jgi:hypothetical protein
MHEYIEKSQATPHLPTTYPSRLQLRGLLGPWMQQHGKLMAEQRSQVLGQAYKPSSAPLPASVICKQLVRVSVHRGAAGRGTMVHK